MRLLPLLALAKPGRGPSQRAGPAKGEVGGMNRAACGSMIPMMKRLSVLTLALFLLVPVLPARSHGPAQFIPFLRKVFPQGQEFRPRSLDLSSQGALCRRVESASGSKLAGMDFHVPVFDVLSGGRKIGVAWMTEVPRGQDFVGVIVGADLKGRIVAVALDAAPPSVDNRAFLDQFKGKTARSPLKVGGDLKAAPKDPALSQRIANGVRKAIVLQTEVLRS